MNADAWFLGVITYTILQRVSEVIIAKRNTHKLLKLGAVEFGAGHYPIMVALHVAFFASLIIEYLSLRPVEIYPTALIFFALAQATRFWIMRVLGHRWTTRVLVIKGEQLAASGPYKYLAHPNYIVVALEIAALPLAFGLWVTAVAFTVLNAAILLRVRIPVERRALEWSQEVGASASLKAN
jgi:methyltransferase